MAEPLRQVFVTFEHFIVERLELKFWATESSVS